MVINLDGTGLRKLLANPAASGQYVWRVGRQMGNGLFMKSLIRICVPPCKYM